MMVGLIVLIFALVFAVLATIKIPEPWNVSWGWLALALLILSFLLGTVGLR
jgi:hypothetical protein